MIQLNVTFWNFCASDIDVHELISLFPRMELIQMVKGDERIWSTDIVVNDVLKPRHNNDHLCPVIVVSY